MNGPSRTAAVAAWLRRRGSAFAVFVALIVLWEVGVRLTGVKEYLLPPPSKVWSEFWRRHEVVMGGAWVTTQEILAGYALAVAVSIPLGCSWADADRLVLERREWIERSKAELTARQAKMYRQPLPEKAEALAHFTRMSDEVYPAFAAVLGGQKPTIKVRDMTSRWGVCVPAKRQITFALQLYNMPAAAQIYVVVHEYCHFLVPNHSMAFWAQVEHILPDWKARRMLLK